MKNATIIIFVKNPDSVPVKTRLAKSTGKEFAVKIYKKFIVDTINAVKEVNFPYFIFSYPDKFNKISIIQKGKDLGERMYNAFKFAFNKNFKKAIIIGSDIPHIQPETLIEASNKLDNYNYVIGPATDGGYYLIGTKRECLKKEVFENINWSTSEVLNQTLKKLKNFYLLEENYDIDSLNDLNKFFNEYKNSNLESIKFLIDENFSNNSSKK